MFFIFILVPTVKSLTACALFLQAVTLIFPVSSLKSKEATLTGSFFDVVTSLKSGAVEIVPWTVIGPPVCVISASFLVVSEMILMLPLSPRCSSGVPSCPSRTYA